MANNFKVWDENNSQQVTVEEFNNSEGQRAQGFRPGTAASASFVNSGLRQANLFAAAFMQMISDSGIDVSSINFKSAMSDLVSILQRYINEKAGAAEIQDVRQDVNTLQGDVSTLQSNVGTLQTNVSTLQGNVSTLQSNVSSIQSSVSSLNSSVSTLQTKEGELGTSLTLHESTQNPGTNAFNVANIGLYEMTTKYEVSEGTPYYYSTVFAITDLSKIFQIPIFRSTNTGATAFYQNGEVFIFGSTYQEIVSAHLIMKYKS